MIRRVDGERSAFAQSPGHAEVRRRPGSGRVTSGDCRRSEEVVRDGRPHGLPGTRISSPFRIARRLRWVDATSKRAVPYGGVFSVAGARRRGRERRLDVGPRRARVSREQGGSPSDPGRADPACKPSVVKGAWSGRDARRPEPLDGSDLAPSQAATAGGMLGGASPTRTVHEPQPPCWQTALGLGTPTPLGGRGGAA